MTDTNAGITPTSLWVVTATIDFPVDLRPPKPLNSLDISLGGEDPDGYVQMRPADPDRLSKSPWWSPNARNNYECRALVRAPDLPFALIRGLELYEHLADRLALLGGYPVEVLSVSHVYSEDALKRCIAGDAEEYEAAIGGALTSFRIQPLKNASLQQLMRPPQEVLEALRWFRHAMLATRILDRYLFYYIAIESVARHVPGVERGPKRSSDGKPVEGLESKESAAFRFLLQRRSLPLEGRKVLANTRAQIAHGNTDIQTIELAEANMRVVQTLALDGIALVCGIDPAMIAVMEPSPARHLIPLLVVQFSSDNNPATEWGGLLSESHRRFVEEAKRQAELGGGESSPDLS